MLSSPIADLGILATSEVAVTKELHHIEAFTMEGILTILWHGTGEETCAVIACGGAMGGLLGPGEGLYHELGGPLVEAGIAVLRISYRRPADLELCTTDVAAAAQMAVARSGGRVILIGHSFGGAVVVRVGARFSSVVAGVATLASQAAGCDGAKSLRGRPALMFHGDRDELLPVTCSTWLAEQSGGELVVLPGDGHLLLGSHGILLRRLTAWSIDVLAGTPDFEG